MRFAGWFDLGVIEAIASVSTIMCVLLLNLGHVSGPYVGVLSSAVWIGWGFYKQYTGAVATNLFIGMINLLSIIGLL